MCWRAWVLLTASIPAMCGQTAAQLRAEASSTYSSKGAQAALPEFQRALEAARGAADKREEAIALNAIGICYRQLGEYRKALDFYQQSLTLKRQLGDPAEELKTLNNIGLVYQMLSESRKALTHYQQALALAKGGPGEAAVENNIGQILSELGRYEEARTHLERAIELGDDNAVSNLGGIYQLRGRNREALPYYESSLEKSRQKHSIESELQDLGNLALCRLGLGEIREAIRLYDEAIALAKQTGQRTVEADWHKGKGSALRHAGEFDAALAEYRVALATYEAVGVKQKRVELLTDLGYLYAALGDGAGAEREFRKALELARAINDPRGTTANLLALGDLEWRRKRYAQSGAFYREALARARKADDRGAVTSALLRNAMVSRDLKRFADAERDAREALTAARENGSLTLEAQALYMQGEVTRLRGNPSDALLHYTAAEQIARASGESELEWRTAFGAAESLVAAGRSAEAIEFCRRAAASIETVRSRLREERFQAGYIADKYQVYVLLVRLLLNSGQLADAFWFAERLHTQLFNASSERGPRTRTTEEIELRERVRTLQSALERENAQPREKRNADAADLYSRELAEAETRYQNLLDDLRSRAPSSAVVPGTPATLEKVQEKLAPGTGLIEFLVGQNGTVVFAITARTAHALEVRVTDRNLNAKVELLRELIARPPGDEWRGPAVGLSNALLAPLKSRGWLNGLQRLYLVPHQSLHYVPFAALPLGPHLLSDDYQIAYLPAAGALISGETLAAESTPRSGMLVLAPSRPGLKFAAEEARAIQALIPGATLLSGARATASTFKKEAPGFDILHIATHASFNKLNPALSALEVEDGRLAVYEILDMRLNARMVTLSACDTAMASGYFSDVPPGDEFVGLTNAFLRAGARSVLATLWEVDDQSTSTLMRSFYSRMGRSGRAESLTAAQHDLQRLRPQYQHPYYWAAFIFTGKLD
jgi:CHAT domain-containing protein/Flp pilus assembly protein TadD